MPRELVLHRYRISIDDKYKEGEKLREPKNKKLKQIIKIMLSDLEQSNGKMAIATDFKTTLISTQKIPQRSWVKEVTYFHESDNAPGQDPQVYTLRIEETPPSLPISALTDFLSSIHSSAHFGNRELMLQALNIILGHHARSNPTITMIGGNKAYPSAANQNIEKQSLTAGLEAIRGYFLSVRLASFHSLVNVNVSHGAFYEVLSLPQLIDRWLGKMDRDQEENWLRLQTFLRGLKVRTSYLKDEIGNQITQVRSIKGFASTGDGGGEENPPIVEYFAAGPSLVWFYLDGDRDFSKQKHHYYENDRLKHEYISVREYFENSMLTCVTRVYLLLIVLRTQCQVASRKVSDNKFQFKERS